MYDLVHPSRPQSPSSLVCIVMLRGSSRYVADRHQTDVSFFALRQTVVHMQQGYITVFELLPCSASAHTCMPVGPGLS